jgi:hypothetical protein
LRTFFTGALFGGVLLLAGAASAGVTDTFDYTLSLPDIIVTPSCQSLGTNIPCGTTAEDDSTFSDYEFSWLGPLQYNASADCPGNCGPIGSAPVVSGSSVNSSYIFGSFSFSGDSTLAEPIVSLEFTDANRVIFFSFEDPNSFWSTPGTYTFSQSPSNYIATSPDW